MCKFASRYKRNSSVYKPKELKEMSSKYLTINLVQFYTPINTWHKVGDGFPSTKLNNFFISPTFTKENLIFKL